MTPRERNRLIADLRRKLSSMRINDPTRGDVQRRLQSLVHARMRDARARKRSA